MQGHGFPSGAARAAAARGAALLSCRKPLPPLALPFWSHHGIQLPALPAGEETGKDRSGARREKSLFTALVQNHPRTIR